MPSGHRKDRPGVVLQPRRSTYKRFAQRVIWLVAGASLACSDATDPSDIAGAYVATHFVLSGDVAGDVLAGGGALTITLEPDGSTAGQLLVPAQFAGGSDLTADMAGTYTVAADTVRFVQEADTFVRDLPWIVAADDRLAASGTFNGTTVGIELTRSP